MQVEMKIKQKEKTKQNKIRVLGECQEWGYLILKYCDSLKQKRGTARAQNC